MRIKLGRKPMQEAGHRDRDPNSVYVVSMVGGGKDDTVLARHWISLCQPTRPIGRQAEGAKELFIRQAPLATLPISNHLEPSCARANMFLN